MPAGEQLSVFQEFMSVYVDLYSQVSRLGTLRAVVTLCPTALLPRTTFVLWLCRKRAAASCGQDGADVSKRMNAANGAFGGSQNCVSMEA
jgi:hypothetical protein